MVPLEGEEHIVQALPWLKFLSIYGYFYTQTNWQLRALVVFSSDCEFFLLNVQLCDERPFLSSVEAVLAFSLFV